MVNESNSVSTYSLADSLTQPVSLTQLVTHASQPLILILHIATNSFNRLFTDPFR